MSSERLERYVQLKFDDKSESEIKTKLIFFVEYDKLQLELASKQRSQNSETSTLVRSKNCVEIKCSSQKGFRVQNNDIGSKIVLCLEKLLQRTSNLN